MTSTKDQRKGWLADLKVGDKVILEQKIDFFKWRRSILRISKITPTGRISVQFSSGKEVVCRPDGRVLGRSVNEELIQWTPELADEVREENRKDMLIRELNYLFKNDWLTKLNSKELNEILTIIKSKEELKQ